MADTLTGKTVAFLVANEGIEQVELTRPWEAVKAAGGTPVLVAPEKGKAQAYEHMDKAKSFDVDLTTADLDVSKFDGVVLPGGVANPDQLRTDKPAVKFLKDWVDAGRPVAAICHGPWTLVEAGVLKGRTITSWPSLQTDVRNAGGKWVDKECQVDGNLVTSRKPDDLDAFCKAMVEAFSSSTKTARKAA